MHPVEWLNPLHLACVALSGLGFALRGVWMLRGDPRLHARWVRIAPHIVDSALLASGIGLAYVLRFSPLAQPWLAAKLIALVIYIVLGTIALKRGRTRRSRGIAFVAALGVFAFILAAALGKRIPLIGPLIGPLMG